MICESVHDAEGNPSERPTIPASYEIDWRNVATVEQAKKEHDIYAVRERQREKAVGAYITKIEGVTFVCANNMQWWRDYWKNLRDD